MRDNGAYCHSVIDRISAKEAAQLVWNQKYAIEVRTRVAIRNKLRNFRRRANYRKPPGILLGDAATTEDTREAKDKWLQFRLQRLNS